MLFLQDLEYQEYKHTWNVYQQRTAEHEERIQKARLEHKNLINEQVTLAGTLLEGSAQRSSRFETNRRLNLRLIDLISELEKSRPLPPVHPTYYPEHIRLEDLLSLAEMHWQDTDAATTNRDLDKEISRLVKRIQGLDEFFKGSVARQKIVQKKRKRTPLKQESNLRLLAFG